MSDAYLGYDADGATQEEDGEAALYLDHESRPEWHKDLDFDRERGAWDAEEGNDCWHCVPELNDPARAGELYRLNPATLAFELVEKIELKSSPGSVGDKTQPDRCEPMKQPD